MSIETASTTYDFSYGNFALRESVDIGERNLASYHYEDGTNWLETLDYGNDDNVQYTYDDHGRVTKQTYEDDSYVTYKYDNSGALAKVYDSQTGTTATYYYDFTDRMMKRVETSSTGTHSVGYTYDNINNLTKLVETIGTVTRETSYTYDDDNRPTSVNTNGTSRSYNYDAAGRVSSDVTPLDSTESLTRSYDYRGGNGPLYRLEYSGTGFSKIFGVMYDGKGRIMFMNDGTDTSVFSYDSADQLIRENNSAAGTTTLWTYDDAGNILKREVYPYGEESDPSAKISEVIYTYGDDKGWGDLLTAYNGVTITHDEIGNPLNDGTWTYTWQHGRQLASMAKIDQSEAWQFTYNADGMRTQRKNTITNRTYNYTYLGSQLTHMTVDGHTLYFAYDAAGTPMGMTYDGANYYYVTNIQGDVVSILNASGTEVVCYIYDAWGNLISTTGTQATTAGFYNPLRYRGYVYDAETELYYLQSRYYDPEMGRFINGDGFASTGQGLLGNNMFAYCLNNPINFVDRDGKDAVPVAEWIGTMWWLCGIDGTLPIGEGVYIVVAAVLGIIALATSDNSLPETMFDVADIAPAPPPQNNGGDDDDLDDDYYDDDSNFCSREKIGKPNGKTPGNNRAQNAQFNDATRGLSKDVRQKIHRETSGKGNGYHEIVEIAKDYFPIGFGTFGLLGMDDEWKESIGK